MDAIYDQITRSAAGNNDPVIPGSLGYSHLEDQLSDHERDLQNAQARRKNQEREALRPSFTKPVDSPSVLRRQLELSRAREQSLHADLFAAEQERETLKALISTLEASHREQQGWEEIAADAQARCAEAEKTISKLRMGLAAATDRVCEVQEQLDHQMGLASRKDDVIQSITRKSRLANTKLRWAEDRVTRLEERLRDERDRRLRETKELSDEQATLRGRHESEMRRLTQEAEDALRDARLQALLDRDHPRYQRPQPTRPNRTGQTPLPPERTPDTGTLPVRSATDRNPSSRSTGYSSRSPNHDDEDTARMVAPWLKIPSCFDMESEVAKEQRAKLEEMIERLREGDPQDIQDVKSEEHDKIVRLQEELTVTKERLRLSDEEARDVHLQLEQSKQTLREVETHVMSLEYESNICQATLREAQDARHASEAKFAEVDQLLRVRQAESESSATRAEESEFKCSQVSFLCAALQERVTELEDQVEKLKSAKKHPARTAARTKSHSLCPTDSHTGTRVPDSYSVWHTYVSRYHQMPKRLHTIPIRKIWTLYT